MKVCGNVNVMLVGMGPIVPLHLNRIAVTIRTTIKVCCFFSVISVIDLISISNIYSTFLSRSDGLVDCEDPECCSSSACRTSQLCVSAPKPIDVLLRKQPPAITASFFERMKFLIDEGSLQNYARLETFNER